MDQPCTPEQLRACLHDIAHINRLTFAYRPTLNWLAKLPRTGETLHIVDVGCGYGDSLRRIHAWASRCRISVTLTGIDLNSDAIRAAVAVTPPAMNIRFVHGDAFSYTPPEGIDVVLSSLLTHHLEDAEIVRFLAWMEATARMSWFINDLHRKPLPYRAFALLVRLVPFHPFVQEDGLVSIRRSFLVEEWQRLCTAASLPLSNIAIREVWPARLCVGHIQSKYPTS